MADAIRFMRSARGLAWAAGAVATRDRGMHLCRINGMPMPVHRPYAHLITKITSFDVANRNALILYEAGEPSIGLFHLWSCETVLLPSLFQPLFLLLARSLILLLFASLCVRTFLPFRLCGDSTFKRANNALFELNFEVRGEDSRRIHATPSSNNILNGSSSLRTTRRAWYFTVAAAHMFV